MPVGNLLGNNMFNLAVLVTMVYWYTVPVKESVSVRGCSDGYCLLVSFFFFFFFKHLVKFNELSL